MAKKAIKTPINFIIFKIFTKIQIFIKKILEFFQKNSNFAVFKKIGN